MRTKKKKIKKQINTPSSKFEYQDGNINELIINRFMALILRERSLVQTKIVILKLCQIKTHFIIL